MKRTYKPSPDSGFTDVDGLSQAFGISKSKIYKMTMSREIPSYRFGGKILFKLDEINRWITGNNDFKEAKSELATPLKK